MSSSQNAESNKLVLQNKDLIQLMGLANLDIKVSRNSIMKIDISDALGKYYQYLQYLAY